MIDLSLVRHIHILGICGTAMGAFATMLHSLGYRISGSDANAYPPMSTQLEALGVTLYNGYARSNLDVRPDLIVVGNVIRRDNPEAVAMTELGIPYVSFPAALSELFLKESHSLVVAGTHGKTTTSSLLAWCLYHASLNPGFLIGGELKNFSGNCRVGGPEYFVVEGDEYDTAYFDKGPKFLHYRPKSAIVTSVEFDHADIYRDVEHVKSAFKRFIELIPEEGVLIACTDYEHLRSLLPAARCQVISYGLKGESEYSGFVEETGPAGMRFVITRSGEPMAELTTPIVGKHNLLNLISVVVLLMRLGLPMEQIRAGVASFQGVRRRQDIIAEVGGVVVVDDFAHHPTAVQVTLDAIRSRFPGQRLWAIFEPRSNTSRRRVFQEKYVGAFTGADRVLIADVYNAGALAEADRFSPAELVSDLVGLGVDARVLPSVDGIVSHLVEAAEPGDVFLLMSNGGFGGIYQKLPAALRTRFGT